MKWTKVKRNMEDLICDKLKDRLSIHLTHYNVNFGEQKRIWVTLDTKEIFNASSAHYVMEHDKLWIEIKGRTDKSFPDCLYECFPEFIGKVDGGEYSTIILEYKGIFNVDLVYDAFIQYPHFLDGPKEIVDRRCIYVIVYTNALRDRIKNYQIK
ncbi:hypothetical protein ABIC37_004922 [Priestia megaterium]|jgi:hypothetical protein|uniref:SF0329 family protein n=1 Tax=Priestia megaterium TaxID=1404 RepID=UPI0033948876